MPETPRIAIAIDVDTSRLDESLSRAWHAADAILPRCICWKPTAPGHQLDCPRGRLLTIYLNHSLQAPQKEGPVRE